MSDDVDGEDGNESDCENRYPGHASPHANMNMGGYSRSAEGTPQRRRPHHNATGTPSLGLKHNSSNSGLKAVQVVSASRGDAQQQPMQSRSAQKPPLTSSGSASGFASPSGSARRSAGRTSVYAAEGDALARRRLGIELDREAEVADGNNETSHGHNQREVAANASNLHAARSSALSALSSSMPALIGSAGVRVLQVKARTRAVSSVLVQKRLEASGLLVKREPLKIYEERRTLHKNIVNCNITH